MRRHKKSLPLVRRSTISTLISNFRFNSIVIITVEPPYEAALRALICRCEERNDWQSDVRDCLRLLRAQLVLAMTLAFQCCLDFIQMLDAMQSSYNPALVKVHRFLRAIAAEILRDVYPILRDVSIARRAASRGGMAAHKRQRKSFTKTSISGADSFPSFSVLIQNIITHVDPKMRDVLKQLQLSSVRQQAVVIVCLTNLHTNLRMRSVDARFCSMIRIIHCHHQSPFE